nr:MAG TPA: hypothetical protein [Caudoviricetes sp.]
MHPLPPATCCICGKPAPGQPTRRHPLCNTCFKAEIPCGCCTHINNPHAFTAAGRCDLPIYDHELALCWQHARIAYKQRTGQPRPWSFFDDERKSA